MTEHTRQQPGIPASRAYLRHLLAQLSGALQMAGQFRGRGSVWVAAMVWLLVGGLVWAYFLAGALAFLHMSAAAATQAGSAVGGGAASISRGQATGLSVSFGVVAVLILLFVHGVGGIPWASLGMRWRGEKQRIFGGAASAVVLYLAAMWTANWVFRVLTTSSQSGAARGYPGMGTPGAQLLADDLTSVTFGGGIWEELTLLAIPVALFTALVPLGRMGRTARYAGWSALVVALLAARWAIHLYYGWIPALHVLVWAAAGGALFVASRTIWPLILAHSLYDAAAFTAARIPAANSAVTWLLWAAVAAAAIVLAGTVRSWWNRTRQTRTNLLTSGGGI